MNTRLFQTSIQFVDLSAFESLKWYGQKFPKTINQTKAEINIKYPKDHFCYSTRHVTNSSCPTKYTLNWKVILTDILNGQVPSFVELPHEFSHCTTLTSIKTKQKACRGKIQITPDICPLICLLFLYMLIYNHMKCTCMLTHSALDHIKMRSDTIILD